MKEFEIKIRVRWYSWMTAACIIAGALALACGMRHATNAVTDPETAYYRSFAGDYKTAGRDKKGRTAVNVTAPDFARLAEAFEKEHPGKTITLKKIQAEAKKHPVLTKTYEFKVTGLSGKEIGDGFMQALGEDLLDEAVTRGKTSLAVSSENDADDAQGDETAVSKIPDAQNAVQPVVSREQIQADPAAVSQTPAQPGTDNTQNGAQTPAQPGTDNTQNGTQTPAQSGTDNTQNGTQTPAQPGTDNTQNGAQTPAQPGTDNAQNGTQPAAAENFGSSDTSPADGTDAGRLAQTLQSGMGQQLIKNSSYSYISLASGMKKSTMAQYAFSVLKKQEGVSWKPAARTYRRAMMEALVACDCSQETEASESERRKTDMQQFASMNFNQNQMVQTRLPELCQKSENLSDAQMSDLLNQVTTSLSQKITDREDWIDAFSRLDVAVSKYAAADTYLQLIEQQSSHSMSSAAKELRQGLLSLMKLKLQSYVSNPKSLQTDQRYLFSEDGLKQIQKSSAYSSDKNLARLCDLALQKVRTITGKDSLQNCIQKQTGEPPASVKKRMAGIREMIAVSDISRGLQKTASDVSGQILTAQQTQSVTGQMMDNGRSLSGYMIASRMQGENAYYRILGGSTDTRSWFMRRTQQEIGSWCDDVCDNLQTLQDEIQKADHIHTTQYQDHEYLRFDASLNWNEAEKYCRRMGGHLAVITSEGEQQFIASLIQSGTKNQYWLGGYYKKNRFRWVTGEKFSYTNWDAGQPDNPGRENYIQIYRTTSPFQPGSQNFKWNNMTPDNVAPLQPFYTADTVGWVCEWD